MTNLPEIGARFYYTGDMANRPGWATVTAHHAPTKYSFASVTLTNDDGRVHVQISPAYWVPSPGRRFVPKAEYDAEQVRKLAEWKEIAARLTAKKNAA